jgi:hypothetical protein
VNEQNGCIRLVAHLYVSDRPPGGFKIADPGLDLFIVKPGQNFLIVHSELHQPVKNEKKNNEGDQYA